MRRTNHIGPWLFGVGLAVACAAVHACGSDSNAPSGATLTPQGTGGSTGAAGLDASTGSGGDGGSSDDASAGGGGSVAEGGADTVVTADGAAGACDPSSPLSHFDNTPIQYYLPADGGLPSL